MDASASESDSESGHTGRIRRTRSRHGPCSGAADAVQTGELPRNVRAPRMVAKPPKRIRSRMPVEHPQHTLFQNILRLPGGHWHLFCQCSSCTLHLGTGRCLHRRCVGISVLRDCQWIQVECSCQCPSCSPPSATPAPWGTRASAARFQPDRCQASTPLAKHGLLSSQPPSLASGHSSPGPKGSRLCIRCQRPAGSAFCAGPVARLL
jgi:hypothetical protein